MRQPLERGRDSAVAGDERERAFPVSAPINVPILWYLSSAQKYPVDEKHPALIRMNNFEDRDRCEKRYYFHRFLPTFLKLFLDKILSICILTIKQKIGREN